MMSRKAHDPLAAFPAALILKVQADAEQDAVDVAEFINRAACRNPALFPNFPTCHLPRETLLGMQLVMRIQRWERNFITIHRAAGVPPVDEVMKFVTSAMQGPKLVKYVQRHRATMLRLLWESILWSLDEGDVGLDIAIVGCDDDQFLDAVAQLLVDQAIRNRSERDMAPADAALPHGPVGATT